MTIKKRKFDLSSINLIVGIFNTLFLLIGGMTVKDRLDIALKKRDVNLKAAEAIAQQVAAAEQNPIENGNGPKLAIFGVDSLPAFRYLLAYSKVPPASLVDGLKFVALEGREAKAEVCLTTRQLLSPDILPKDAMTNQETLESLRNLIEKLKCNE